MSNKALIIGFAGEQLTEQLKRKIEITITLAIKEYNVTDFYFANEENAIDAVSEKNIILKEALKNSQEVQDFTAGVIQESKKTNLQIRSAMMVARPSDNNFNKDLYDEIIQGYLIYHEKLDSEDSLYSYDIRNSYLAANIDIVFWYSNKILCKTSALFQSAEKSNKIIVFV